MTYRLAILIFPQTSVRRDLHVLSRFIATCLQFSIGFESGTGPVKCGISMLVCLSQLVFLCILSGMQGLICNNTDSSSFDCSVVMQRHTHLGNYHFTNTTCQERRFSTTMHQMFAVLVRY